MSTGCLLLLAAACCSVLTPVLHLYRQCIRLARTKPAESRPAWLAYTRAEFTRFGHVSRRDIDTIEFLLRQGAKKAEMLGDPTVKHIQ